MKENSLAGAYRILRREMKKVASDRTLSAIVLFAPLFYAFFYGFIYVHKVETDVPIVVVDRDHSEVSRQLVRYLDAHQTIRVADEVARLSEAQDRIDRSEVFAAVYVPIDFESSLKKGKGTDLAVYIDGSRFLITNDVNKAVNEVIGTLSAGVRLKQLRAKRYTDDQALALYEPVWAVIHPLFNPAEGYGDFMLPGLMGLILQQTLLIGVGVSVAKDREEGKLGALYRVSHGSVGAILTGKGVFYVGLYGIYAFFFYTAVFALLNVPVRGHYLLLAALTLLMLIAVASMSFFVASFFRHKVTPLQFYVLTTYPLFLMSGYSWPLASMPAWIQALSRLSPGTPFLAAFSRVVQMGGTWSQVRPEILHLSVLAVVYALGALARMFYLTRTEQAVRQGSTSGS